MTLSSFGWIPCSASLVPVIPCAGVQTAEGGEQDKALAFAVLL